MNKNEILHRVKHLRVDEAHGCRAPYKPLLLLLAIAKLQHNERKLPFPEVEAELLKLFQSFAPPIKAKWDPRLPYWHLRTDKLWEVPGDNSVEKGANGRPRANALRQTYGALPADVWHELKSDAALTSQVTRLLLDRFFPSSLHQELSDRIGFAMPDIITAPEATQDARRLRDPEFRNRVLQAYEHRCAVSGFRFALNGAYMVCEAAHIKWHSYEGPDTVANGLALEPTLHRLFDLGAWSLTDDRRILVSKDLTGDGEVLERLRSCHGKPLRRPLDRKDLASAEFIRWHREPKLGGVFKMPPLAL